MYHPIFLKVNDSTKGSACVGGQKPIPKFAQDDPFRRNGIELSILKKNLTRPGRTSPCEGAVKKAISGDSIHEIEAADDPGSESGAISDYLTGKPTNTNTRPEWPTN